MVAPTGSTFSTVDWPGCTFRDLRKAKYPHHWQQQHTLWMQPMRTLDVESLTKMRQHEKAVERSATPVSVRITARS